VLVAGEEAIGTELEALAGRGGTLEARIGTLGRTVHESRGGLSRGEKSLEESRDRRSAAGLELEKAQQRIERQEDRVRALESRKAELTLDLERLIEELGGREAAREAADSRLREVAESVSGLSAEIAEGERALGERVAGRRAQEEALESLRGRRFEIVGREARLANEITGREELLGRVRSQTTRVTGEREEASAARDAAGERLRASEAGRSEVELRLAGLGREIQEAESRVVRARGAREEAAARLAEAERHEEAIRHRLATIRELSSERAYGTESLQDFFGSVREEAWAPLGIVADFIEVAPEYESVIEDPPRRASVHRRRRPRERATRPGKGARGQSGPPGLLRPRGRRRRALGSGAGGRRSAGQRPGALRSPAAVLRGRSGASLCRRGFRERMASVDDASRANVRGALR
jgi:chromosome segregation ATPase